MREGWWMTPHYGKPTGTTATDTQLIHTLTSTYIQERHEDNQQEIKQDVWHNLDLINKCDHKGEGAK
jgi:hypothetical protein